MSLREDVLAVLEQGRACGCGKTAATCRELLAAVQTRRLQGLPVLDYLYEALVAHRTGLPVPQLLPPN